MSLSVKFHGAKDGDDGPFSLCSASGWKLVAEWAHTPLVQELVLHGTVKNSKAFAVELKAALADREPTAPVLHTLRGLLCNIGLGDEEESVSITDD